jgi:hypothetical protein
MFVEGSGSVIVTWSLLYSFYLLGDQNRSGSAGTSIQSDQDLHSRLLKKYTKLMSLTAKIVDIDQTAQMYRMI